MRYNKRGFSLVELLAVVVILGILSIVTIVSYNRYIKSSKDQANKQLEKNAIMATKSYLQANKQYQPKNVGDVQNIYLEDLINNNYLKESDFTCEDGKKCDHKDIDINESYVNVSKESNSKYKYEVSWGGSFNSDNTKPYVGEITFSGNKDDTSELTFTTTLYADKNLYDGLDSDLFITSYSYVVYINLKEVFNSGTIISTGNKKIINLKDVDVSKYLKINEDNDILVKISVTNNKGIAYTNHNNTSSSDREKPNCGSIEGEPPENKWLTKEDILSGKKRTISVECLDTGGSKCKKKKYTKIWDNKSKLENDKYEFDSIMIYDNKGNSNKCDVRVNIDLREPDNEGPIIKLYSDNGSGEHGFATETFSGQKKGDNPYVIGVTKYDTQKTDNFSENMANANNWLNKSWYPEGIYYYVDISDSSGIKSVIWSTNSSGKKSSDKDFKSTYSAKYTPGGNGADSFKNDGTNFVRNWQIGSDGMRYATIVAEDNDGNETKIEVYANIDHTPPSIPTANIRRYNSTGEVLVSTPNPDNTHNYITEMWWGDFAGTDKTSGSRQYEFSIDCKNPVYWGVTNSQGYTKPNPGYKSHHSCYNLRQLDNAGNYSERSIGNNNTTSWSEGYRMDIEIPSIPTFTYKNTLPDWKVIYNTPGVTRNYCDKWSGKPNILGTCPDGVYANIVGRVNASYSNGNVTFDWYIANGGETWIGSSYYVELVILPYSSTPNYDSSDVKECSNYSSSKVTACEYLKEAYGDAWLPGSSNSGKSTISLSKGAYDVYFAGNSETPSYTQYMGWIEIN